MNDGRRKTMSVTDAIAEVLDRSGYSQRELSGTLGMSESYLSSLLYRKSSPTVARLIRVCDVLGYDVVLEPRDRWGTVYVLEC